MATVTGAITASSTIATAEGRADAAAHTATIAGPIPSPIAVPAHTSISASSTPVQTPSVASRTQRQREGGKNGPKVVPGVPDGRIKSTIPNRLKNVDKKNGNFAVMHMDLNRRATAERHAAAKRTSEGTAAIADEAYQKGYQPLSKRKLPWEPTPTPEPQRQTFPSPQGQAAQPSPASQHHSSISSHRPFGLSAQNAKSEQARLLTLLRSLHPVLVVDQLCKALAYFGGIPGAPPPADGTFPESVTLNGSGSLLVGWLAEIFPPVDGPVSQEALQPPLAYPPAPGPSESPVTALSAPAPVKRGRGRPKGSKGTKARKDKGIKKSAKVAKGPSSTADNAAGASGPSTENQDSSVVEASQDAQQPDHVAVEVSTPTRPTAGLPDPESSVTSTPGSKKRGRPKGSRNRPRTADEMAQESPSQGAAMSSFVSGSTTDITQGNSFSSNISPPLENNQNLGHSEHSLVQSQAANNAQQSSRPSSQLTAGQNIDYLQPAGQQSQSGLQPIRNDERNKASQPKGASRKRKAAGTATTGELASASTANTAAPSQQSEIHGRQKNHGASDSRTKRRRTSKETSHPPALSGTDSQSSAGMSGSPVAANIGPPISNASSFDSQSSRQPNSRSNSAQWTPHQQLMQSQQQQKQQQWQRQQQSPNMAPSAQKPQQTSMPRTTNAPMRTPTAASASASFPAQHMSRAAQGYLAHRQQMSNPFGRGIQPNSNIAGNNSSQFQQQGMATVNQGAIAGSGSQQRQRRPSQQQLPTPVTSAPQASMGQFQTFGDGYMSMDYGDGHDQTASTYDDQGQLEAALAEPGLREHLYQAINRR